MCDLTGRLAAADAVVSAALLQVIHMCDVRKIDAVVAHPVVMHASLPNAPDTHRWALQ